jgi:tRNA (cytidine32/uridine32-2'-O)-methyltransferase
VWKLPSIKEKVISNIDIILVSAQIPDNIGLVARVLKNTSFSNLSLVKPNLTKKSFEVAKRARDILEKAKTFKNLKEATATSYFIFGTTRRQRQCKFIYNFNDIKNLIISLAGQRRISIIFGQEDFGLSQEQIEICDSVFYLPANPHFPSYNLAFSVGIICYELFNTLENLFSFSALDLAKKKEVETFFDYLEKYLSRHIDKKRLAPTMRTLERMFLRTHLTRNEVALLKSLVLKNKN